MMAGREDGVAASDGVNQRFQTWLTKIVQRMERDLPTRRAEGSEFDGVYHVQVTGGRSWWIAPNGDGVAMLDRWEGPAPTAVVTVSPGAAEKIAEDKFRMQSVADSASVQIEGDAGHLVNWLLPYFYSDVWHQRVTDAFQRASDAVRSRPWSSVLERVERPSADFVAEALATYRPFVLTGVVERMKAAEWTFENLRATYGDLVLEQSEDGRRPLTVADRIDGLMAGKDVTTGGRHVPERMRPDLDFSPYASLAARGTHANYWMGGPGARTALHRDAYPGMSAHMIGRKRWLLFSPDQVDLCYPEAGTVEAFQRCRVDPIQPNLKAHPRFAEARVIDAVIEPGEILLVPVGWFHDVTALDPAVSVTLHRNDQL